MTSRIDVTDAAKAVIKELVEKHGPLMFYQAVDVVKERNLNVLKKVDFIQG
ncbi:Uncharacterized protein conserved in bacteria [Sphingobacterium daejeonense]|nr:Uncharacterized protein conserved in bacteria [Sphingobacterium daejeonense]